MGLLLRSLTNNFWYNRSGKSWEFSADCYDFNIFCDVVLLVFEK